MSLTGSMNLRGCLAAVVAAVVLTLPALAQESQPAAESKPAPAAPAAPTGNGVKDYQAMLSAVKAVKTASYVSKMEGTGVAAGQAKAPVSRCIVERPGEAAKAKGTPGRFRVTALGKPTGEPRPESRTESRPALPSADCAFDGKVFRSINHGEKVVHEAKADGDSEQTMFYDPAVQLLMWPLFEMGDEHAPPVISVATEGTADVGGVSCVVLALEQKLVFVDVDEADLPPGLPTSFKSRLFVGRDDHLPRRISHELLMIGGDEEAGEKPDPARLTLTITDLKVNIEVTGETFTITVPEGYAVKPLEVPAGDGDEEGDDDEDGGEASKAALKVGDVAPEFTLKDAADQEHKLADWKGKVVVLDFWATWCEPCKMAMPGMQKLYETFKDRGVVVCGVDVHDDGDASAYMKKQGYTYQLLLKGDTVAKAYGVGPIPHLVVIGPDGKVAHRAVGFDKAGEAKLTEIVEKLLGGPAK